MARHRILLTATLAAVLASGAATFSVAAGSVQGGGSLPAIAVAGNEPWSLAGLMPGDALPDREVRIAASGCVRYWLAPSVTGDEALGDWIEIRATSEGDGTTLTAGRVRDLDARTGERSARTLCDGQAVVRLGGSLHRDAPNAVQGASGSLTWTIYAVAGVAPER